MPLEAHLTLQLNANFTSALDFVTGSFQPAYKKLIDLLNGTGAGQADRIFWDQRTLGAGASEDLDLAGALVDAFGATITFARIKLVLFVAAAANPNNLVIGGAGSNAFVGPFGASTHTHSIRPGGFYAWGCSEATGYVVTAATADLLHVLAGAGGNHIYDVFIIGASA